jgi:esterase/lipase superfamily enzyme
MYATYPGKVAKDGAGANSPFALALARHMTTPNQGIGEFLRSVAADVRAQTNNAQLPQVVSGQPDREFVFYAVGASSIAEKQDYEAEIRKLREQVALLSSQVNNTRRIRVVSAGDATPKGAITRPETWTDMGGDRAVEKGGAQDEFQAVEILFGTSRKMEPARQIHGRQRLAFSGVDDSRLTLGKTIVTIPRNRARGTLSRPILGIEGFISIQFRPENPAWDFTIQRVTQLNGDEFGKEIDWKIGKSARYKGQVLVFVHGYNTGFDDAMYRAAQLAHDLDFDGPTVAFSWPSYARALGYLHDSSTVETSGRWLHDLLVLISRRTKATTINLIAHSMGNRAVLSALNYAAIAGTSLALNEFVLAAPDVSRTEFIQKADLIRRYVKGATLYASANDRALTLSRQLRYAEIAVAGHVPPPPDVPVVEPGVDTIDVTDANTSLFFTNHTTFAERRHLMRDMQLLLTGGKRPPDARNPFLSPTHGAPIYWRYVPN